LTERSADPEGRRGGSASSGIKADIFVCRFQDKRRQILNFVCRFQAKEKEEEAIILFADNRQERDGERR
jgi:hypothetical protein